MTRVIAGRLGGRRLQVPDGAGTRPTADRAREGLFSSLQSQLDLEGARVLDLYAGSGALGIEALSRGAATATFVESDEAAAAVVRANLTGLGLGEGHVVTGEVERFLGGTPAAFDLVLADPPYRAPIGTALAALVGWLAPGAVVVVERATRDAPLAWPEGICHDRSRRYGEATLWYGFRS